MSRVGVGVEQTHGHRLDLMLFHGLDDAVQILLIQRNQDLAGGAEAFLDAETEMPGNQGIGFLVERIVHLKPVAAPDLQNVPEAVGRDQRGLGPCALNERIDDHGGPVGQKGDLLQADVEFLNAFDSSDSGIGRRRQNLAEPNLAGGFVQQDAVGERPAYVGAESVHWAPPRLL